MRIELAVLVALAPVAPAARGADPPAAPTRVRELWADVDPRKDALDAAVGREWEREGVSFRTVAYLTVYVAGVDARATAAAPSVGGSGFRTQPWPLLPAYQPQPPNGDARLFDAALGCESYAPTAPAPLLWLGRPTTSTGSWTTRTAPAASSRTGTSGTPSPPA